MSTDLEEVCTDLVYSVLDWDDLAVFEELLGREPRSTLKERIGADYKDELESSIRRFAEGLADRYRETAEGQIEVDRVRQGLKSYVSTNVSYWKDLRPEEPSHCFSALEQMVEMRVAIQEIGDFPALEATVQAWEDVLLEWMRHLAHRPKIREGSYTPKFPPLRASGVVEQIGAASGQDRSLVRDSPETVENWNPDPAGPPEETFEVDIGPESSEERESFLNEVPEYMTVPFQPDSYIHKLVEGALMEGLSMYVRVDLEESDTPVGGDHDREFYWICMGEMEQRPERLAEDGNQKIAEHVRDHVIPTLEEEDVLMVVEIQKERRTGHLVIKHTGADWGV